MWVAWYPSAIGIQDEAAYLAHARIVARGNLTGAAPGDLTISMIETPRGVVSKYPPGQAVVLAPTQWGPWRMAFVIPLALLLTTTWMAAAALQRDNRSPLWAALILFHPTLLLYARTLMSDVTVAACLTAAFLWSDDRRARPFLAGMALGAAPFIRMAALPVAGALGILMLWRLAAQRRYRAVTIAVAGALIPLATLAAYNAFVFGEVWVRRAPMSGYFDWPTSPGRALFYLVALNLVWPLLAFGIATSRHLRRLEAQVVLGISFVVFSGYYFVDRRFGLPADFVVGLRFFVPILPILVIVYVERLEDWISRLGLRPVALAVGLAVAFLADAALVMRHQRFLDATAARREIAVAEANRSPAVVVHGSAAELMSPAWGAPPFTLANSVEEMLAKMDTAGRETHHVLFIAQGAAGDSLVERTPHDVERVSGLTLVRLPPGPPQ
jgi:hypothetical protein